MLIKITIPDMLMQLFTIGDDEVREAIADYICDVIYYNLCKEVDNGKD